MRGNKEPKLISGPVLVYGLCVLALLAGAAAAAFWKNPVREQAAPSVREAVVEKKPPPSLYCLFFDFTHASVVVGFDFAVLPTETPLRFAERAEAVRSDPAVNFDADSRPNWSYSLDGDGNQMITSPDGATRIVLYGLKLGTSGVFWIEAGIRSNTFRNLDGKCLQSHLDDAAQKGMLGSVRP